MDPWRLGSLASTEGCLAWHEHYSPLLWADLSGSPSLAEEGVRKGQKNTHTFDCRWWGKWEKGAATEGTSCRAVHPKRDAGIFPKWEMEGTTQQKFDGYVQAGVGVSIMHPRRKLGPWRWDEEHPRGALMSSHYVIPNGLQPLPLTPYEIHCLEFHLLQDAETLWQCLAYSKVPLMGSETCYFFLTLCNSATAFLLLNDSMVHNDSSYPKEGSIYSQMDRWITMTMSDNDRETQNSTDFRKLREVTIWSPRASSLPPYLILSPFPLSLPLFSGIPIRTWQKMI